MATLGRAELEAMSREYFCDDLTVDFEAMTTWDKADVHKFFESGGAVKPAAGAPSAVDVADAVYAEAAVLDAKKRGSLFSRKSTAAGAASHYTCQTNAAPRRAASRRAPTLLLVNETLRIRVPQRPLHPYN